MAAISEGRACETPGSTESHVSLRRSHTARHRPTASSAARPPRPASLATLNQDRLARAASPASSVSYLQTWLLAGVPSHVACVGDREGNAHRF